MVVTWAVWVVGSVAGDGGDDVEWLGEALRAVGVDKALRPVGAVGGR